MPALVASMVLFWTLLTVSNWTKIRFCDLLKSLTTLRIASPSKPVHFSQ